MFTQIYGIRSVEDVEVCRRAGADAVGICPPQFTGDDSRYPSAVPDGTVRAVMDAAGRAGMRRVLIALGDDPAAAEKIAERYRPELLQVASSAYTLTPRLAAVLRRQFPGMILIQAVPVTGPESIKRAVALGTLADILLLDTANPDPRHKGVGAAGLEHDRSIDRAIIEAVGVPVIIAGGLGPDNVRDAVLRTRPWGVDSLTKTSRRRPDGTWYKEEEAVRRFCDAAREAEAFWRQENDSY